MEIRVGWATEFGRDKFDVSLDETDLRRILGDSEFPDASLAMAEIDSGSAFMILKLHAQRLAEVAKLDIVTEVPQRKAIMTKIHSLKDEESIQLYALKVKMKLVDG